MKFRDPKTGKVHEDIFKAYHAFCNTKSSEECANSQCQICFRRNDKAERCYNYCEKYPDEAARLMGYEVIEDTPTDTPTMEDNMEKKDNPRLAEILGIEVGEKIKIAIPGKKETGWFQMDKNGCLKDVDNLCDLSGVYLAYAINHPESIIRTPRLTEPELAICNAIGAMYLSLESSDNFVKAWMDKPGIEGAGDGSWIRFNNGGNLYSFIAKIRKDLFPSVHPGDLIEVL